jgi:hypothetical protein
MKLTWRRIRRKVNDQPDPETYQQKREALEILIAEDQEGIIDLRYFDESGFCLVPYIPYAWQEQSETISTDAKTNLYLSHGRLSIGAEYSGLSDRKYKNDCAQGPRSSNRPLYTLVTSTIGEGRQGNLFKINSIIFFGIFSYSFISH